MKGKQLSIFERAVLDAIAEHPKTSDQYARVAATTGTSSSRVLLREPVGKGPERSAWKRKVRWIQQTLKAKGYAAKAANGWEITGKGKRALTKKTAGVVVVFTTMHGIALWANAKELPALFDGEIDLILTSPEYLLRSQKEYSKPKSEELYLAMMLEQCGGYMRMLNTNGSIVLNLGDVFTHKGAKQSLYKERLLIALEDKLGLSLIQGFSWWNPIKLPNPIQSVCVKRTHVVPALESFYWLSPTPEAVQSDNRRVLSEYSESHKKMLLSAERKASTPLRVTRPSGNTINADSFYKDRGGCIPHNVLVATPEGSNSHYARYCRSQNLPIHPCRFPKDIPEFFVKFLTKEGGVVMDPMGGSCRVGAAAEDNKRHWICADYMKEYLLGGMGRFSQASVMNYL